MSGIDYLVSRFPVISETFIVRELDGVAAGLPPGDVGLRALFPAPGPAVHEPARRWLPRLIRPGAADALRGLCWASWRHPRGLAAVIAQVVRGYARRPRLLTRALITVPLAAAHARDLADAPDRHLHAHYATYPALAAWICARLAGVGYSFTVHAHDLYVDRSMLATKIAGARFVVTVSEFNRAMLTRVAPPSTPIEVVHCGIRVAEYRHRPRHVPATGPIRLLCVASLQEYKGHRVLLDALARGGTSLERVQVDLIGDGPLRDALLEQAADLGLTGRVHFHGGRSESQVRDALDGADLFVLPSLVAADGQMEGLPVALMEALACGVPTISTDLSGIPEIVVHGVTGLLATPGDAAALADAIEQMIALGPAAEDLGRAGRDLVEREFDGAASAATLTRSFGRLR